MKKLLLPFFVFGAMLSASTVTVNFVGPQTEVPVRFEDGASAGPYGLRVNGTSILAMCMDDFRGVSESWTANVTSLASSDLSKTVLGNNTTNLYGYQLTSKEMYSMEAYLFQQLIKPGADRSNLQLAAWSLMDSTTLGKVINANDTAVINDLYSAYNNRNAINLADFQILSDVRGTNQEFMVASPEPATFALMGAVLVGAGATRLARRKKLAA